MRAMMLILHRCNLSPRTYEGYGVECLETISRDHILVDEPDIYPTLYLIALQS